MFCFLACSADQTLFYFGKKNQGTCRQNKLWSVHVTSALNSLPCLFDFSHSCRGHEIVSCFSYWWRVYKRQTINIYLCVHRGFAFKWTSAHISSKWQVGLTSVASSKTNNTEKKKKTCTNFWLQTFIFPERFPLKDRYFWISVSSLCAQILHRRSWCILWLAGCSISKTDCLSVSRWIVNMHAYFSRVELFSYRQMWSLLHTDPSCLLMCFLSDLFTYFSI